VHFVRLLMVVIRDPVHRRAPQRLS
jgi:hypothetical protein